MNALYVILWFVGLAISILAVFDLVGMRLMIAYFPEGRRWWMLPAQLLSLAVFAAFCIWNPIGGWK